MKTIKVSLDIFEKGDKVSTPDGVAEVLESEEIPEDKYDICYGDVRVKYYKANPDRVSKFTERINLTLITEKEFKDSL